ncbi:hypothetical protein IMSAGC020_00055 [Lachnospiraceae bacterium]|nr:hypothetical protein IMSAGC020_00055 [Lachnospiraceae bacterium]
MISIRIIYTKCVCCVENDMACKWMTNVPYFKLDDKAKNRHMNA